MIKKKRRALNADKTEKLEKFIETNKEKEEEG